MAEVGFLQVVPTSGKQDGDGLGSIREKFSHVLSGIRWWPQLKRYEVEKTFLRDEMNFSLSGRVVLQLRLLESWAREEIAGVKLARKGGKHTRHPLVPPHGLTFQPNFPEVPHCTGPPPPWHTSSLHWIHPDYLGRVRSFNFSNPPSLW